MVFTQTSIGKSRRKAYFALLQYKLEMATPQVLMEEVELVKKDAFLGS